MATQSAGQQATDRKLPLRDLRREVTDNIVEMLEKGVAPWQKPWERGAGSIGMPVNPTTERAYRGGNAIHLMATGLQKGYADPRWMTYQQAAGKGWHVRRGEKGTQIEFWDTRTGPEDASASQADHDRRKTEQVRTTADGERKLVHRVYTVFNAAQLDGIPDYAPKRPTPFEVAQSGEEILRNSGAKISHAQRDQAYYSRVEDAIHLPPRESFKDTPGYYGTALHELAHWSGHPSRLNRSTLNESYRFGDLNYAKEELRAELASVFLAAERGIPHDPEQHAAYVGSWITALKHDKNEIFRAARDASAATDFLMALERERSIGEEELAVGPVAGDVAGGSPAALLEAETAEVHRDRERLEDVAQQPAMAATPGASIADSLAQARLIAASVLGHSATAREAQTDSGTYRGPIIGVTDLHVVQRQTASNAVAHPRELLDRQPQVGENVRVNYSNSKGVVREVRDRGKSQGLGR